MAYDYLQKPFLHSQKFVCHIVCNAIKHAQFSMPMKIYIGDKKNPRANEAIPSIARNPLHMKTIQ